MLDIFDILGPVMVGPSSSHTAGAVRIGSMARTLLGDEPVEAKIHLHGSFAETGPGHGTDRALVAGLLGMKPDDLRIPYAYQEAKKRGLEFTIDTVELRDAHPNTAVIETWDAGGKKLELQACSVGGGRILVNKVDGIDVSFDGMFNTLVIRNQDENGAVAAVTSVLNQLRIRGQYEPVPPQAGRRRADGHRAGSAPQAQPGGVSVRAAGRAVHDLLRQGGG